MREEVEAEEAEGEGEEGEGRSGAGSSVVAYRSNALIEAKELLLQIEQQKDDIFTTYFSKPVGGEEAEKEAAEETGLKEEDIKKYQEDVKKYREEQQEMKSKLEEQESELAKIMRELEEKEQKLAEALAEQQAFEKTLDEMDEKAAAAGIGSSSRNLSGVGRRIGVLSEVAEEEEDELEESRRLDEAEDERRLEEIEGDIARFKQMQEEDPPEEE